MAKMYVVGGRRLCEPCATKRATDERAAGKQPRIERALDPTVCAECGADKGDTEWLKVGGTPLCFQCRQRFYEVPFPAWTLLTLFVVFAVLGYALWHGSGYVESGATLARGERLLAEGQYAPAAAELRQVLASGSESESIFLQTVKACLLAGDYEHAKLLMNGRTHFDANSRMFLEVDKIWDRAVTANDLAAEARRLAQAGESAKAAAKMQEAAALYPEMAELQQDAKNFEATAAAEPAPSAPERKSR
jgi:tetratricopeptide (TPR) repeat protein